MTEIPEIILTEQTLNESLRKLSTIDILSELFEKLPDLKYELGDNQVKLAELVRTILGQQLSTKVAATLFARLTTRLNNQFTAQLLHQLTQEEYLALGISRAKSKTIRGLSFSIIDGTLSLDALPSMSNPDIHTVMLPIWGIGPWTVQCVLVFQLNRADVWPKTDLGIIHALRNLTGNESLSADEAETISKKFAPYRSVAARLLWKWINFIRVSKL